VTLPPWIRISPSVRRALAEGRPVVALESAVFSHGLPAGDARGLAGRVEAAVREAGAEPACIAIQGGRAVVGLAPGELEFLFAPGVLKVAERDLAVAIAQGRSGGTTVAGTLAVAAAAGVRVMSTGGIGGVHLGVEVTGDVSADLAALARRPMVVVCAGPKAICDPRRTVEMLDSLGVTLVGFRTAVLPAFLAPSAGVPLPHRVDRVEDLAAIARAKAETGDGSALLVVQAPPAEAALREDELDEAVKLAVKQAAAERVCGADLTPFLLATLAQITGGRSLTANLAVLEANARLAARIAANLADGDELLDR
jgi:pseudouridine-5'-phosphate glycosidase